MRTMVQWFKTQASIQPTKETNASPKFTKKSSKRLAGLRAATLLFMLIGSFAAAQENKVFKMALVRYNLNGSLDASFSGGRVIIDFPNSTSEKAYGMCFDDEGKAMLVGSANGQFALTLYHTDGTIDGVFGNNGRILTSFSGFDAKAHAVAVQPDRKFVVAGRAIKNSDGDYYFAVARYNSDGSLDDTFDGDGKILTNFSTGDAHEVAYELAIQSNGKIVVAGGAYANGGSQFALVRYNPNGSLDTAFDGDGKVLTNFTASADESAYAMELQGDGKIVAGGSAVVNGSEQFALARYNTNGKLDATFDGDGKVITNFFSGPSEAINDIVIQADGKIVAAGAASANGSNSQFQFALARYNTNGKLDATFDKDGRVLTNFTAATSEAINGVALLANGRIAAGGFAYINGHFQFAVARYNTNGSLDASFDGDGKVVTNIGSTQEEFANAIGIDSDGKIVVAGEALNPAASKSIASAPATDDVAVLHPETYALSQNNPNPFNPTTTIQFGLKESGWTTLKIYNAVGQEVAVLVDGNLDAGQHTFNFNAADLPSGVYFYQVLVNDFRAVKKMQLVK